MNRFRWILVSESVLQKKGKALLILLAVVMGASVVSALLNLQQDLRSRMNRELRDYGPNVLLSNDSTVLDDGLTRFLKAHSRDLNILSFTPQLFVPAVTGEQQTMIVGGDLRALRSLYPGWKWQGSGSVFAGRRIAARLRKSPGSEIEVNTNGRTERLKITGLIESGESEDDQLIVDLSIAQRLANSPHRFQIVALSVLGDIPAVQKNLQLVVNNFPGLRIQLVRKVAVGEASILDQISHLMLLVILIIFATLFFCINTTVSAILLSRQSEIALCRVLGARRKQIMSNLVLELLTLAILGGIFGFLLGIGVAQILGIILFHTFIIPKWNVFLITVGSSLAVLVLASALPVRHALNRQASLVLKEA